MRNIILSGVFIAILISCQYLDGKNDNTQFANLKVISKVKIKENFFEYNLDSCFAVLKNNTLILQFDNKSLLSSPYELKIEATDTTFISSCSMTYAVTDSSFKPTILKFISQNIYLNQKNYEKGDIITGSIDLKFLAFHSWGTAYTDTVKIYGKFITLVN